MPTITPRPARPGDESAVQDRAESGPLNRGGAEERAFIDTADMFVEQGAPSALFRESHEAERGAPNHDKGDTKEAAVKQRRVWVRVTRLCNQRCIFCLDSWNQNGTYVARAELEAFIRRGREQGGQRLILSGGEATVHPDFLRLIRYGREVGYDWIQTVTNGQLFAYPQFARKAKLAGLNEATFSMHGHTAKLHDALVGLPGAFDRANEGIRNLQALGSVVTNVDIVINRQNVRHLRDMLDFYMNMGIHEFDLLFIVPFGRGFEDYRDHLFFDPREHFEDFQRAFELSKQPGVYIWTNRLPVEHLEGYEHLIQDPHKLHSEVNGGRHNFDGYLQTGTKPDCYGERCEHCFLNGLCRTEMFGYREALLEGGFDRVRWDVRASGRANDRARARMGEQRGGDVEVVGGSIEERRAALGEIGAADRGTAGRRTVQVNAVAELEQIEPGSVTAVSTSELSVVRATDLPAVVLLEQRHVAGLLDQSWSATDRDRTRLRLQNHEYASESRDIDPTPEQLRALAAAGWAIDNVPVCVGGRRSRPGRHRELSWDMLDARGNLGTDSYVHRYIVGEYYAKSLRCEKCPLTAACRGMHINYIRNHGFVVLDPARAVEPPRAEGTA